MTRDYRRTVDELDDSAVLSALWAAAPFPQLPPDAPAELRNLTISVVDPKRLYTVHRASRRHNFQVLVERYVDQLRHGCQAPLCATPTCFTCRRRVAGKDPVRRYNHTSARTLACYLASQPNPEHGLCPHLSPSTHGSRRPSHVRTLSKGESSQATPYLDESRADAAAPRTTRLKYTRDNDSERDCRAHFVSLRRIETTIKIQPSNRRASWAETIIGETPKSDHRSFIQNLFNTLSLRSLEWLTPAGLEAIFLPKDEATSPRSSKSSEPSENINESRYDVKDLDSESSRNFETVQPGDSFEARLSNQVAETVENSSAQVDNKQALKSLFSSKKNEDTPTNTPATSLTKEPIPNEFLERSKKGISISDRENRDGTMDELLYGDCDQCNTFTHSTIQELKSHLEEFHGIGLAYKPAEASQNSLTSDPSSIGERNDGDDPVKQLEHTNPIDPKIEVPVSTSHLNADQEIAQDQQTHEEQCYKTDRAEKHGSKLTRDVSKLPQTLLYLPVEVIEFLCDILQNKDLSNTTLLQLQSAAERSVRAKHQSLSETTERVATTQKPNMRIEQWNSFSEQSFFYVLSDYRSLLQSFTDNDGELIDSHSMWYIMLRMTRVKPSIILHSLWLSMRFLFIPPPQLRSSHEWTARATDVKGLKTVDAASLISIALHALVAVIPLVEDPYMLLNMSRFRSHSKSLASSKNVELCLQYNDAMSDEVALRLARRLFSAIPARQQFQELVANITPTSSRYSSHLPSEEDILEIVLAPLNSMGREASSLFSFHPPERALHKKRMPILLLDWARTVILQDWDGSAVVPTNGSFGGALALMSAMYFRRDTLLLDEVFFRTEYFAEHLNAMNVSVDWLSFNATQRSTHLLNFPFLFSHTTLVNYFRAINYSRMNRNFEQSGIIARRMQESYEMSTPGFLTADPGLQQFLHDRLKKAASKFLIIQVRRDYVLLDALDQLWRRQEREILRPLKVHLGENQGEEGSDSGGVQQEFFRLVITEALDPARAAFTVDDRTKMTWFLPGSPEPLWKFEMIGLLVALAIYNGLTLPVTFPQCFYRKLLSLPVDTLAHISDGWPELSAGLTMLQQWNSSAGSVADVFSRTYEFSLSSFGQHISRDMSVSESWPQFGQKPSENPKDVRMVTEANRDDYIRDYIQWLTDISIRPQFEAFSKGFFTVLDKRSVNLFNAQMLQSITEGVQNIDVQELKLYTRYIGWDSHHNVIKRFWKVVEGYDFETKKKLMEFVTASDRIPVGGVSGLQFVIQRNGGSDDRLPTAYTCYGTLLLPEYESEEILKDKLGMALENARGFGFA